MVNPYQSPEPDANATLQSSRPMRMVRISVCLINLAVAGSFAASGLAVIFSSDGSMGALSALLLGPIFVFYAVCEALAIVRPTVERTLGYANLACAAFVIFGVVANTLEAITRSPIAWGFLYVFLPISGGIAAYLICCGWVRLRIVVDVLK